MVTILSCLSCFSRNMELVLPSSNHLRPPTIQLSLYKYLIGNLSTSEDQKLHPWITEGRQRGTPEPLHRRLPGAPADPVRALQPAAHVAGGVEPPFSASA